MKVENINPFMESVSEVFENMLESTVTRGEPTVDMEESNAPDIIGVIGLTGTAQGMVALKLPVQTALAVVGRMAGSEFKAVDSSIIDGVGELVNIISGNAKAKLKGHSISLSLPMVVRGSIYKLNNLSNTVWFTVPFKSTFGDFAVAVCFKPAAESHKEAMHAGANSR